METQVFHGKMARRCMKSEIHWEPLSSAFGFSHICEDVPVCEDTESMELGSST